MGLVVHRWVDGALEFYNSENSLSFKASIIEQFLKSERDESAR
jgi:hypothetical protein